MTTYVGLLRELGFARRYTSSYRKTLSDRSVLVALDLNLVLISDESGGSPTAVSFTSLVELEVAITYQSLRPVPWGSPRVTYARRLRELGFHKERYHGRVYLKRLPDRLLTVALWSELVFLTPPHGVPQAAFSSVHELDLAVTYQSLRTLRPTSKWS